MINNHNTAVLQELRDIKKFVGEAGMEEIEVEEIKILKSRMERFFRQSKEQEARLGIKMNVPEIYSYIMKCLQNSGISIEISRDSRDQSFEVFMLQLISKLDEAIEGNS